MGPTLSPASRRRGSMSKMCPWSRLAQVCQHRPRLASEALDLCEAFFVGANEVENDVASARLVKSTDALNDLRRRAERAIALSSLAKIHRIARAERGRRGVERFFVGVVDPREKQMGSPEATVEGTPGRAGRCVDLFQALPEHVGGHDIGHPAVGQPSDAPQ